MLESLKMSKEYKWTPEDSKRQIMKLDTAIRTIGDNLQILKGEIQALHRQADKYLLEAEGWRSYIELEIKNTKEFIKEIDEKLGDLETI